MLRGKERPMPAYMSKEQQARYLDDLRSNKPARPSGSRPPPPSKIGSLRRTETETNVTAPLNTERPSLLSSNSMPIVPQDANHKRADSNVSLRNPFAGRAMVRPPSATPTEEDRPCSPGGPPMKRRPSMTYMERGTRWMEKQEVKSVRMAMEDMDLEEEKKVHAGAQDEAAELVWKHQNPDTPFKNPDTAYPNPDARRDYRSHLRKGSYQRSHSQDMVPVLGQRIVSSSSQESGESGPMMSKRKSTEVLRKVSPPSGSVKVKKMRSPSGKSFGGLAEAVAEDIVKARRRISSGSKRILSGEKKMFMHPKDKIYEDPQEDYFPPVQQISEPSKPAAPAQLPHMRKNPFARVRMQAEKLERSNSEPILPAQAHHRVEIQRNSPAQSRNPWYMANEPLPPTPPSARALPADEVSPKVTPTKEGKEIRADDIRAATSKQRKDYSPKLPRPTMVSDKPGRPIVSFKQDWKPKEVVMEEMKANPLPKIEIEPAKTQDIPQICVDEVEKSPIPTINVPSDPAIPTISLPDDPVVPQEPQRPLPRHAATSPLPRSTPHYTPSIRQSGVLCAHCALPIAGRILSAAGDRFHPTCFVCHQCHTNLELVAFYPEPDKQRCERLERISTYQSGEAHPHLEGMSDDQLLQQEILDGDPTLRFYCHLDFHELFSPRCKSCKTPIEGEVIVACGAEWHAGHFFCAQCGDPFDSSMPFVEKDGYAWCVGCHTNRYSSKCRKCKKPVTDTVVKALGFDWHGNCFVCTECNGDFQDERYFLRGESPVCVKCEERRLKA